MSNVKLNVSCAEAVRDKPKTDVLYLYGGPQSGKSVYAQEMLKDGVVAAKYMYEGGDCTSLMHAAMGALNGGWNIVIESNMKPPKQLLPLCTMVYHCESSGQGESHVWGQHQHRAVKLLGKSSGCCETFSKGESPHRFAVWTMEKGPQVGAQALMPLL